MTTRHSPLSALDQQRYELAQTGKVVAEWNADAGMYQIPGMELWSSGGGIWLEYSEPPETETNYADTAEFCACEIAFVGGPRDGTRTAGES